MGQASVIENIAAWQTFDMGYVRSKKTVVAIRKLKTCFHVAVLLSLASSGLSCRRKPGVPAPKEIRRVLLISLGFVGKCKADCNFIRPIVLIARLPANEFDEHIEISSPI